MTSLMETPEPPGLDLDFGAIFDGIFTMVIDIVVPILPYLIPLVVLILFVSAPMPGRGAGLFKRRDAWRGFKYEPRRIVLSRAGNQCESGAFLVWGRCADPAEEADHIYPWSKGGATVVSNGQALCKRHNRSKSNMTPPWWYLRALERRRRTYYPEGEFVRISAKMTPEDRALRGQ